jgi:hypothetical protein
VTQNGYIGIGSLASAVGNGILVLIGSCVPSILWPADEMPTKVESEDEGPPTWHYVSLSDSYVHGDTEPGYGWA